MASAKRKCMAFALLLVVAFLAVPPVSAKEDVGYTICPSASDDPVTTLRLSSSIGQGETNRHQFYIGSGVRYLEVYLDWGPSPNPDSLALTIYTPSWKNLGTLRDISDGQTDDRIHIDINPNGDYVDQGTWTFDVYGEQVSSQRSYTLNVYQHS